MNEIIIGIAYIHALCFIIVLFASWADVLTELGQRPTAVAFAVLFSLTLMAPLLVACATVRVCSGYMLRIFVPILVYLIKKTTRGKS